MSKTTHGTSRRAARDEERYSVRHDGAERPEKHDSLTEAALEYSRTLRRAYDRGPRPWMRGRLHSSAAWYFAGISSALIVVTAAIWGASPMTASVVVYGLCLVGMLTVSALYHRAPWRHAATIDKWRRADHAMIAVFIAGTYGPLTVGAFGDTFYQGEDIFHQGGWWILLVCWIAAIAAVGLNIIWINHPRWVAVTVYMVLGWLSVLGVVGFYEVLGPTVLLLVLVGGLIYTLGAIVYARKWPNPSERWFGFHEVFHATTIVAAALHNIAIWLVVTT